MLDREQPRSGPARARAALLVAVVAAVVAAAGCTSVATGTPAPEAGTQQDAPTDRPGPIPTSGSARPSTAPSTEPGAYDDPQGRFHLVPPPGWDVDTSGTGGTAVLFTDPQLVGGQPVSSLAVAVFPSSIDLAELLDQTRADLESRGMRLQPAQPVDLADGTPAQRFEGILAHPQDPNVEVHSLQLLAVHDGAAYAVIAGSGTDAWPQNQAQLQESVESLRFTG